MFIDKNNVDIVASILTNGIIQKYADAKLFDNGKVKSCEVENEAIRILKSIKSKLESMDNQ